MAASPSPSPGLPASRAPFPSPPFPLRRTFPALASVLGPDELASLESAFGASLGPTPGPAAAGRLAAFLVADPAFGDRPVLVELAAFEWALVAAAEAPEADPVPPEELDGVPPQDWPAMRLTFHPSLRRITTEWNATALWRAVRQGTAPPAPARLRTTCTWAVWTQRGRSRFRPLPPDDAWGLDLAMRGQPFEAISRALCRWLPPREASPHAARMVGDWIDAGWVTDLRRAPD